MSWVRDEMKTARLGDTRLEARMEKILGELADKPEAGIPQATGKWGETMGACRFFDNGKATFEKVLKPHRDATLERIGMQPVVLPPQDTTDSASLPRSAW